MDALLLALLLNLTLDQGTGSQRMIARLRDGETPPVRIILILGLIVAANAVLGASMGVLIAAMLPPQARLLFLAIALLLGGGGLCWAALHPGRPPESHRPSLTLFGRITLRRAGENAAFATSAVVAFTGAPILAAAGAAIGGWAALVLPLSLGSACHRHGVARCVQGAAGLFLLCGAIACAAAALRVV